uniref:Transmembrane protein 120Ab n=1 Tax=Poecilia latipinna TaxID=48699 RepID=A0A3B3V952_9TELE
GNKMPQSMKEIQEEWKSLEQDFQTLQETHKKYLQKLDEISKLQSNCSSSIARQRKRLKEMSSQGSSADDAKTVGNIKEKVKTQEHAFSEMDAFLPKKNGLYLSLVLGNVNVTLLSKQSKFAYKDEYEKFKLCLTVILLLLSFVCLFFVSYSIFTPSTKKILKLHLFSSNVTFLNFYISRPDGILYQAFRGQFLAYSLYQNFVQCLQYYYQSGCLYRLRTLGERHNMDLTVEGFQSWMWKGLTFLLPFLFFGHFWQLLNGVSLFRMARLPDCREWQVRVCGACFLILFMGNFFTTLAVVRHKSKSRNPKPKSM